MESKWKPLEGFIGLEFDQSGNVRNAKNGKVFSHCHNWKYIRTSVSYMNKKFYIHRLVWQYHNGPILDGFDIHHKDENKHNNNIDNLELIEKRKHKSSHKKNSSRLLGAYKIKGKNYWFSAINQEGIKFYLGSFATELQAHNAYCEALGVIQSGGKLI